MRVRFVTLDVFTEQRFAGNPLAVVLDGQGLDEASMLAIAREFNFSETTFVLPPRLEPAIRRVRIFTPGGEIPFAGHPTVGTALALLADGQVERRGGRTSFVFDLDAGPTPVTVDDDDGRLLVTFQTPRLPAIGDTSAAAHVAAALGLAPDAIVTTEHEPIDVGTGLDFVIARLRDLEALAAAAPAPAAWSKLTTPAAAHGLVAYVPLPDGAIRMRMFAPAIGIMEDPATGSAAAALGGLLATLAPEPDGILTWRIAQGVEMGRPSRIDVAADKAAGAVTAIRIAGSAVPVMAGTLTL